MSSEANFILIGASVRAAAFSALRAGLTPYCVDLFTDTDLCAVAETRRIPFADYPQQFLKYLRDAPAGPVVYTGGLENHPRLIERIAAERPLWGNARAALERARDPFFLHRLLCENGLPCPEVSRTLTSGPPMLRKPLRSAGGSHIAIATDALQASRSVYYQEFIPGPSFAAIFCAFAERSVLLGVTEQLVGEPWLNAKPFHYCGSIGPVTLSASLVETLDRLGDVLRRGCDLRGLFGVDFILHDDQPWPVEVNPRYTASVEVLEYATGIRALEWHRGAFESITSPLIATPQAAECVGKAILFAPARLAFPASGPWSARTDFTQCPDFADVPRAGEIIEAGWPVLTIFAQASTNEDCRQELRRRTDEVLGALPA